jgi:hypothetical protein
VPRTDWSRDTAKVAQHLSLENDAKWRVSSVREVSDFADEKCGGFSGEAVTQESLGAALGI